MSQGGAAGNALQGQQNTQANTVAQATNAMQQFNAQNQQAASAANQSAQQQANAYNAQNAQNVSNANTATNQYQTEYNAQVPETVFENQLQKATGQSGIAENQANQATQAGQQQAGLIGGLLGSGAEIAGDYMTGGALEAALAANKIAQPQSSGGGNSNIVTTAHGGIIPDHSGCYHEGGICMEEGGMVPGRPKVPGDSLKNDTVTAHVSPGEAVIPRTSVSQHLPEVLALMSGGAKPPPPGHHPQDVATLLAAMRHLRGAA